MAEENMNNNDAQFEEPSESDKELVSWIMDHVERWRDLRDNNYMDI
jgi:hypothetical protein